MRRPLQGQFECFALFASACRLALMLLLAFTVAVALILAAHAFKAQA